MDRSVLALNPKSVGYAYAFFRGRCNLDHNRDSLEGSTFQNSMIAGWPWDVIRIAEYGWKTGQKLESYSAERIVLSDKRGQVAVIIPDVPTNLKHCLAGLKTTHLLVVQGYQTTNNLIFSNEVGN
ncbi:hypothetical protein ANCDUO_00258 [Ancylostoma duodenale]|uniref:Uncharacterized protein n=1 Tax=Ancylostoma duodenale TaxID=51022 RepID=A0A0C2DHI6_9BILA|nr:hypothetical protein ANCDUO_00258 [Ancylostoma duodenale]